MKTFLAVIAVSTLLILATIAEAGCRRCGGGGGFLRQRCGGGRIFHRNRGEDRPVVTPYYSAPAERISEPKKGPPVLKK